MEHKLGDYHGNGSKIVVGTLFDARMEKLLPHALNLARRNDMVLRLVHAVEQGEQQDEHGAAFSRYGCLDSDAVRFAEQRLSELADTTKDITVETNAICAEPAESLIADAIASNAALILCGARPVSYRFTPQGLSTAMALMSASMVPVMVIREDCQTDFSRERLRVVVADDLRDDSIDFVDYALTLAGSLGSVDVLHVHIQRESGDRDANDDFGWFEDRGNERGSEPGGGDTRLGLRQQILERLENRAKRSLDSLAAQQCTYSVRAGWGTPTISIAEAADAFRADIAIFGRHHAVHLRPFAMGRIPLHAMLSHHRPVVVVPTSLPPYS